MLRRDAYDADDLLPIGEAAALVRVHPDTLRRWAADGKVACRRTPTNQRRFRVGDLREVIRPDEDAAESSTDEAPAEVSRGLAS